MTQYIVKIFCDVDDNYEKFYSKLSRTSHKLIYWYGIVPPHKVEIILGPLTETGVKNWEESLKDLGIKYKLLVAEESQYIKKILEQLDI